MLAASSLCAIEEVSTFTSSLIVFFMNRIQFWILVTLSSLVFVFQGLQAVFSIFSQRMQIQVAYAQQAIQQGRTCDLRWRQLIERIAEVSQKTQDQGLKDILTRQGVTVKVTPSSSSSESGAAPSPAPAPAPAPANP
jgi:hypothetical protein